jgi:hypothetical protein
MRMHACLRSASLYSRAPATTWRSPLQGSQRRHGKKLPAACVDLLFRMQKTCVVYFLVPCARFCGFVRGLVPLMSGSQVKLFLVS